MAYLRILYTTKEIRKRKRMRKKQKLIQMPLQKLIKPRQKLKLRLVKRKKLKMRKLMPKKLMKLKRLLHQKVLMRLRRLRLQRLMLHQKLLLWKRKTALMNQDMTGVFIISPMMPQVANTKEPTDKTLIHTMDGQTLHQVNHL
mgnify:CR=1 FL=1|jgi:hypothetical protein